MPGFQLSNASKDRSSDEQDYAYFASTVPTLQGSMFGTWYSARTHHTYRNDESGCDKAKYAVIREIIISRLWLHALVVRDPGWPPDLWQFSKIHSGEFYSLP